MDITFTCPRCGIVTQIEQEVVGQSGPCRNCDAVVTVTADAPRLSPFGVPGSRRVRQGAWSCLAWIVGLVLLVAIVIAALTPAVMSARQAARRMMSQGHLKQIGLAFHNYHDTYKQLPRAYYLTTSGERTLSWRVAITPFLEHHTILDEYHPEEPWNSPANFEVNSFALSIYRAPWNSDLKSRETGYMVITGPGTLFEEGKAISFDDCGDDLSTTILAVEVMGSGVPWNQPVDLDILNMVFKINGGGMGIRSPWDNGANVLFADGSVVYLPKETLASTLKAMITRSGGEQVQIPRVR